MFRVSLLPKGPFAAVAEARGRPFGFAQFQMGRGGKLDRLELSVENGQTYDLQRQ